jgi:hypothetical protein
VVTVVNVCVCVCACAHARVCVCVPPPQPQPLTHPAHHKTAVHLCRTISFQPLYDKLRCCHWPVRQVMASLQKAAGIIALASAAALREMCLGRSLPQGLNPIRQRHRERLTIPNSRPPKSFSRPLISFPPPQV